MLKFMYDEPQQYFKQLVTLTIDETGGCHMVLMDLLKLFAERLPFIVMNDFRVSQHLKQVVRIDLLKKILAPGGK